MPTVLFQGHVATPVPARDEAHVWRVSLDDVSERDMEALEQTLAAGERARAARFHAARDRIHFTVARALLRAILGHYLAAAPEDLRFVYGPHGKPALALECNDAGLSFNLAHARGRALYAITCRRRVGIDVEEIRRDIEYASISGHYFSPREAHMLRDLPAHQRREAFFRCWTRKEAYVKGWGEGLSLALDSFDVSLAPADPPALLATRLHPGDAPAWSLHDVDAGPAYAAALAVEGHAVRLVYRSCPGT